MKKRAIKAAKAYLERKGFEILENDSDFDLLARDEDDLVFVNVFVKEGELPEDRGLNCAEFESKALPYFLTNDFENCPFRYDELSIAVLGDQALLRHRFNAVNN